MRENQTPSFFFIFYKTLQKEEGYTETEDERGKRIRTSRFCQDKVISFCHLLKCYTRSLKRMSMIVYMLIQNLASQSVLMIHLLTLLRCFKTYFYELYV